MKIIFQTFFNISSFTRRQVTIMLPVFFYKTPLKIRLFTGLTINSVKTLGKPNENTEILQLSHKYDSDAYAAQNAQDHAL